MFECPYPSPLGDENPIINLDLVRAIRRRQTKGHPSIVFDGLGITWIVGSDEEREEIIEIILS